MAWQAIISGMAMPTTILYIAQSMDGRLTPNSEFSCESVSVLLARLEQEGVRSAWLVGDGAALEDVFVQRKVDRIERFTVPMVLGQGPRSFQEGVASDGELEMVEAFPSGMVHSTYSRSPGFPKVVAGV